jgi:hypothetical protein
MMMRYVFEGYFQIESVFLMVVTYLLPISVGIATIAPEEVLHHLFF